MKLHKIFLIVSLLLLPACGTYRNSDYYDYDHDTHCNSICQNHGSHYNTHHDSTHKNYNSDRKKRNVSHIKEKIRYVPRSNSNSLKVFHKKPEKIQSIKNDKKYNKTHPFSQFTDFNH